MLAALAILCAVVAVDPGTRAVTVTAKAEALGDVLAALHAASGLNLMVDGALERRSITVDARYPDPPSALRAISLLAGAVVDEADGLSLVHLPRKQGKAPLPVTVERIGSEYLARSLFDYPVQVLRDAPEDATARAIYGGFERRAGISLVVAASIKERALREYLESREGYRAILEQAQVAIELTAGLDVRSGRVYVEPAKSRYLVELLYSFGPRGEWIAHFVYVLDAQAYACQKLYIFRARAPS